MYQSEQINELDLALSKAQGEIFPAIKDTTNPFFKSKYADLSSVWNVCRTPLSKNGLAIIQTTREENGKPILVTTLVHSSGQWIELHTPILTTKNDAQGFGAAMTYMRRYSLSAMVGICQEDDDGNTSSGLTNKPAVQARIQPQMSQITPEIEPKMSVFQANELKSLLEKCNPTYRNKMYDYLKKNFGDADFTRVPANSFDSMRLSFIKNIEEGQLKSNDVSLVEDCQ